eukprot:2547936-Rhodomonas_salina.1
MQHERQAGGGPAGALKVVNGDSEAGAEGPQAICWDEPAPPLQRWAWLPPEVSAEPEMPLVHRLPEINMLPVSDESENSRQLAPPGQVDSEVREHEPATE